MGHEVCLEEETNFTIVQSSDSFWIRSRCCCGSCSSLPPRAGAAWMLTLPLRFTWAQNKPRPVPAAPALPTDTFQLLLGKAQGTGTPRQPSGAIHEPVPGTHTGPGWIYAMTFLMILPRVT